MSETWRKRFLILRNRLYLYPPAQPLERTRSFWIALGLVGLAALLFSGFFIVFLTTQHAAYLTHAEDLGILDQAIWSLTHGQLFHQTICATMGDTNCFSPAGISRFAIHFEPILFLVAPLYLLWSDPRLLQILQVLVVAAGAFPAFWLARLRLRNEWAAVVIALLYLLYPAQQWATIFDFHAVTLTAAFLLFALYFLYTRNNVALFIFVVLALACKEEIAGIVALMGLWMLVFQQRWRTGVALLVLAVVWTGIGLLVVHIYSPLGHSLLSSRYDQLGHSPLGIVKNMLLHPVSFVKTYILSHDRRTYLLNLFAPTGYVALLAPWVWILAVPTMLLNMLSSYPQMYSGFFQYDAEIVPVLIFATIESLVLILWFVQFVMARRAASRQTGSTQTQEGQPVLAEGGIRYPAYTLPTRSERSRWLTHYGLLGLLLAYILFNLLQTDYYRGTMPYSINFTWPSSSAHVGQAQHLIDMIPANASVSAQSSLVPHVSHRTSIYMFPYNDQNVDYVFLDVTSDIFPYVDSVQYIGDVKTLLLSGRYGVVAAQDGYLLLKRGLTPPELAPTTKVFPGSMNAYTVLNLPDSFCSYLQTAPQNVTHPINVTFSKLSSGVSGMELVGYDTHAPDPFGLSSNSLDVTTYWKLTGPVTMPLQVLGLVIDKNGRESAGTTDFPATLWCQTHTWKLGTIMRLTSRLFNVQASGLAPGQGSIAIALLPLLQPSDQVRDAQARLPFQIAQAPSTVSGTQANALKLQPIMLNP